jgi:hypothetical protein
LQSCSVCSPRQRELTALFFRNVYRSLDFYSSINGLPGMPEGSRLPSDGNDDKNRKESEWDGSGGHGVQGRQGCFFFTTRASEETGKMTGEVMTCMSGGNGGSESINGRADIFNRP